MKNTIIRKKYVCAHTKNPLYICMHISRSQVKHLEKKKSCENSRSYTEDQKSILQQILQFCCTEICTIFTLFSFIGTYPIFHSV